MSIILSYSGSELSTLAYSDLMQLISASPLKATLCSFPTLPYYLPAKIRRTLLIPRGKIQRQYLPFLPLTCNGETGTPTISVPHPTDLV